MTRAETITAERDRMRGLLADFETGRIPPTAMPSDAYQYYARINETNEELKAIRQQVEYNRQLGAAFNDGYRERKAFFNREPWEGVRLEQLRAEAQHFHKIALRDGMRLAGEEAAKYPALSLDDAADAYRRGARKAVTEWYFEEKNRHGFGRKFDSAERVKRMPEEAKNQQLELAAHRAYMEKYDYGPPPDLYDYESFVARYKERAQEGIDSREAAYRAALQDVRQTVGRNALLPGIERALAENEVSQRFTAKMDWEIRQRPPMTQEQRANVETQVYRSIASDLQQERQQQSQRQSAGQGMRA